MVSGTLQSLKNLSPNFASAQILDLSPAWRWDLCQILTWRVIWASCWCCSLDEPCGAAVKEGVEEFGRHQVDYDIPAVFLEDTVVPALPHCVSEQEVYYLVFWMFAAGLGIGLFFPTILFSDEMMKKSP